MFNGENYEITPEEVVELRRLRSRVTKADGRIIELSRDMLAARTERRQAAAAVDLFLEQVFLQIPGIVTLDGDT